MLKHGLKNVVDWEKIAVIVAAIALEKGLKRNEANGQLKRYMDKLYFTNPDAGNIRIYAEKVWIFSEDKLVTVFGIPQGLKDQANTQIKRKSIKENYMGN